MARQGNFDDSCTGPDAGVDVITLIDQDQMTTDDVRAVVDEAHARRLPVVAHAHRPEEIRRALKYGPDDIEHTGLATAPEYRTDVIDMVRERTAQMALATTPRCSTTRPGRSGCPPTSSPTSASRSSVPAR